MTLGMDLRQASSPRRISSYGPVAPRQKVAMPRVVFVRREAYDRGFAVAETMRQSLSLRVFPSAVGQFAAKSNSQIHLGLAEISPFPQQLPHLDERLHLSGARQAVVDQAAILVSPLVKVPNGRHAKVREIAT